jgi:hypothetical protein
MGQCGFWDNKECELSVDAEPPWCRLRGARSAMGLKDETTGPTHLLGKEKENY